MYLVTVERVMRREDLTDCDCFLRFRPLDEDKIARPSVSFQTLFGNTAPRLCVVQEIFSRLRNSSERKTLTNDAGSVIQKKFYFKMTFELKNRVSHFPRLEVLFLNVLVDYLFSLLSQSKIDGENGFVD